MLYFRNKDEGKMKLFLYNNTKNFAILTKRWFSLLFNRALKNPILMKIVFGKNSTKYLKYQQQRHQGPRKSICHAPHLSMYFGIDGVVRPCCRNKAYTYGSYPNSTIVCIWNNSNRINLIKHLNKSDLSQGCLECYNHLFSENFSAVVAKMFDYQKKRKKYPTILEFELDNTCNLECIMCAGKLSSSIRANRENLPNHSSTYDSEFVNQLEEFIPYLEEARFYGGEPFLIQIYYEIWERIIALNPSTKIYVQTNGTILNDKIKTLLKKGKFVINISIDAIDKELFEKIRKNSNYNIVMKNLAYFHNYCIQNNTFFCITPTFMRENWMEFPKIVEFCNNRNIPLFYNTLYRPRNLAINTLKSSQIKEISEYLNSFCFISQNNIQKRNNLQYSGFISLLKTWLNDKIEEEEKNTRKFIGKDIIINNIISNLRKNPACTENPELLKKIEFFTIKVIGLLSDENEILAFEELVLNTPISKIVDEISNLEKFDNDLLLKYLKNYL